LSYLLKNGCIQKDKYITGNLSWTKGSNISFASEYNDNEAYIRLMYTSTNNRTNEVTKNDYKIYFTSIPSNLGKGEVLYFVCPVLGKRCRILYNCYGSLIWKSREAYRNRIYYESQIEPKSIRPFKYLFSDRKFEELYKRMKKTYYRGKPTRLKKRIDELTRKHDHAMQYYHLFEKALIK